jgi:hypothetical protein
LSKVKSVLSDDEAWRDKGDAAFFVAMVILIASVSVAHPVWSKYFTLLAE